MFLLLHMVKGCNTYNFSIKKVADTVAHQIVNGLNIQFFGQPLLYAIDYSKFSRTLFRFF